MEDISEVIEVIWCRRDGKRRCSVEVGVAGMVDASVIFATILTEVQRITEITVPDNFAENVH